MQKWVDLELTAGSVEHVWEPARGIQELLALEATGTRHIHAQTYMQATHPYIKLKKKMSSAARKPIHTSLKCTSSGVTLGCQATPHRTGTELVPSYESCPLT